MFKRFMIWLLELEDLHWCNEELHCSECAKLVHKCTERCSQFDPKIVAEFEERVGLR